MTEQFKIGKLISPGDRSTPVVTPSMVQKVSTQRKAILEDEVRRGLYIAPGYTSEASSNEGSTYLSNVSRGFNKTANFESSNSKSNSLFSGQGNVTRVLGEIYSPLWMYSNLNLPRDRATINAWSRAFYALNPFVHNAINLHSTYPIAKLNISCKSRKIEQFFANMIEDLNLMDVIVQIAQEFWILGESIVYAQLNGTKGTWSNLILQNPDYIVIKHSVVAGEQMISLRPDENFKRIINGTSPNDIAQRKQLDPAIVDLVRRGENIPLHNFQTSHLARRISPYETRGTGLIVPAFKALMLFDLFREAKYTQASSFVNPITLVKLGSDSYHPTASDVDAIRDIFEAAEADRNYKIFSHKDLTIERIGAGGGIYDIQNDITQLIKEIYIALMVPSVIMDGGADISYANGTVALDVLKQRYIQFRTMLTNWLRKKIFAPIAELNDFYEREDGKKTLIVPEVEWNSMNLFDSGDYIANLMQLVGEKKVVSRQTLYKSLGLDWEEEKRRMKEEAIWEAIHEKEQQSLLSMPLNELRSLNVNDEIPELKEAPLPGVDAQGLPGVPEEEGGGSELPGVPPPPQG